MEMSKHMSRRFLEWEDQIRKYCEENNLSFEKAKTMSECYNKDMLVLQYFDPECESVKLGLGLQDETPMPPVLWMHRTENGVRFDQTEYTQQYLSL